MRISVVILNWNGLADTQRCLDSVFALGDRTLDVIVIDNGSRVDEGRLIEQSHPSARVIRREANLGFAGGCNVGMREARAAGSDYIWFLNNDCVVGPESLEPLKAAMRSSDRIAVVGSRIVSLDDPARLLHLGGRIEPLRGLCPHLTSIDGVRTDVDFVTGASMLVNVRAIEDVGAFDESYFLYWEDADWCTRFRKEGWTVCVDTESVVVHEGSASLGRLSARKNYYLSRNSIRFVAKNYPLLLPFAVFWWPRHHLVNHLYYRRFRHARLALIGLSHAITGSVIKPEHLEE